MFGGNFAPRAWALCDGQLLPINQNSALFSIIGTIYGGDGRTTFALPDIRGRAVLGPGNGPGLPDYKEGQKMGAETHTLTSAQMPSHNHSFSYPSSNQAPITGQASVFSEMLITPTTPGVTASGTRYASTSNGAMNSQAFKIGNTGGGQSYDNMMPYQTVNYVICMQGVFPSRS